MRQTPKQIWADTINGDTFWMSQPHEALGDQVSYTRSDLRPSPDVLKQVYAKLESIAGWQHDNHRTIRFMGKEAQEALAALAPFVEGK